MTTDENVAYFAYNRTAGIVIVAAGLLYYMFSASFSYATWDAVKIFNVIDAWIFASCAFVILCGFDIGYEVFYQTYFKRKDESKITQNLIKRKLFVTAIIIALSILILKMHEYAGLCLSVYGRDPEYDLMQYHNGNTSTPEGVEILKARLHTMCKFSRFWFTLDYADD